MKHILHEIVAHKQKEIAALPLLPTISNKSDRRFIEALLKEKGAIIGEIKPKSPSKGVLMKKECISKYVSLYTEHVQAISVLCDEKFFGGGFNLLHRVRSETNKPILAKEFIVDAKQIDHIAHYGADAILLIAMVLDPNEIAFLSQYAVSKGLDILLEVHNQSDVDRVISAYRLMSTTVHSRILIGINNRDLDTLEIDLQTTETLAPVIRNALPDVRGIITESGVSDPQHIAKLSPLVEGFLIGTSILSAANPETYLQSLHHRKVKFCGMMQPEDIQTAEGLGVDYIGLIFASSSPRCLGLEDAKSLYPHISKAKSVGVFTDMSTNEIQNYANELELDFVQLHGEPSVRTASQITIPTIQAFRGVPSVSQAEEFLATSEYILVDKADGQTIGDFEKMAQLPEHIRAKLFLAGGLQPSNVAEAIETVTPYAVDCASGIEKSSGKKEEKLMSDFLSRVP